jgi:hypothetical protein
MSPNTCYLCLRSIQWERVGERGLNTVIYPPILSPSAPLKTPLLRERSLGKRSKKEKNLFITLSLALSHQGRGNVQQPAG